MRLHIRHLVCVLAAALVAAAGPAAAQNNDAITAARFTISIDGQTIADFTQLVQLASGAEIDPAGGARKASTSGLLTLARPMTDDRGLWTWHEQFLRSPRLRSNMVLVMSDFEGQTVATYSLTQAWPAKVGAVPLLTSGESPVLMETVTIVCEHLQRVSP